MLTIYFYGDAECVCCSKSCDNSRLCSFEESKKLCVKHGDLTKEIIQNHIWCRIWGYSKFTHNFFYESMYYQICLKCKVIIEKEIEELEDYLANTKSIVVKNVE